MEIILIILLCILITLVTVFGVLSLQKSKNTEINDMEKRIADLMGDDEIQKQLGIIPYVLTGDEHYLDLRSFPEKIKLAVWEKQQHKCAMCGKELDIEFMEGDHITPWREKGRTVIENCQMLCRECNRRKGGK